MKKVAIVGVEGSGKTVMLAGLGHLYSRPDVNGYFLCPKNFQTAAYVSDKIARMRKGEWPTATADDVMQGLDWTLRRRQGEGMRPKDVCEVSCLDFAGEVYRYAFVRQEATPVDLRDEVQSLKDYVREADDLIVLINLRDIIVHGEGDPRVQEAMWITNAILSYALDEQEGRSVPRAAIVLSQADSYLATIRACGGPKGVLAKYLPHVANNYDWLDVLVASAVDKTRVDRDGNTVPAEDFTSKDLRPIMGWICGEVLPPPAPPPPSSPQDNQKNGNGCSCLTAFFVLVLAIVGICLFVNNQEETSAKTQTKKNAPAYPNWNTNSLVPRDPWLKTDRPVDLSANSAELNERGDRYYYGRGVVQDYSKAVEFYRNAAKLGNVSAQDKLGWMYENGLGVTKNYSEAFQWYRKAAEWGCLRRQNQVGWFYQNGWGVRQDYGEAVKWYRKAADQGNANSQNNLGWMYQFGYGVKPDYGEAVKWYRKAADQGNAFAQDNLGWMYQKGYGVRKDYVEAMRWHRKAAEQGNASGQQNLGVMYHNGLGVMTDYGEALKWIRKSANQNNARSQCWLGFMYEKGNGVQQDYWEALRWYRMSAAQGDANGQCNLGEMYEFGRGVSKDVEEAVKWYRKAAAQGFETAKGNLKRLGRE